MRYGDIILDSIRKMFLNNDNIVIDNIGTYITDKKYKTYLDGIYLTINEAINILLNNCRPYLKEVSITKDYDISSLTDFKRVNGVYDSNNNELPYELVKSHLKTISSGKLIYEATYAVADNMPYTDVLAIPVELARLISFYVAGERYKDDDLTLATIYMNEFESGMERVKNQASKIEMTTDLYGGF